jgi:hypothetical protein
MASLTAQADPRDCPYVGLDPFEATHAAYFFGRGQDSKVIADHVLSRSLTVVYGASGVGKSSILNVGLPAALSQKVRWIIVRLRDWQDPAQLERQAVTAVKTVLETLGHAPRRDPDRLRFAPLVAWAMRSTRCPLLLILDQFEEYFLYRDRTRMRDIEMMMGDLLARRDLPLRVLVALRDDSLHRLDHLRAFVPGILDTTVELGQLSDAGVAEAIRGPIRQYNAEYRKDGVAIVVEDGLVATLIRQLKEAEIGLAKRAAIGAGNRRIELPYLQLTLTKLWAAEGGLAATALRESTLTEEARLGGVRRIVRDHVRTVMESLTPEEQALCARIFDRLVTGIGSKIAYPTEALAADDVAGPDVTEQAVAAVLGKLTPKEARILKPVTTNGLPGFEIFHDVLGLPVLEWKRAFQRRVARRQERARAAKRRQEELAQAQAQAKQEYAARRFRIAAGAVGVLTLLGAAAIGAAIYGYVQAGKAQVALVDLRQANGKNIWVNLDFTTRDLTPGEVNALWDVTGSTGPQLDGFLKPIASSPDPAVVAKFGRNPEPIKRALGLSWPPLEQAEAIRNSIFSVGPRLTDPIALRDWQRALGAIPLALTPEQSRAAVGLILAALRTESAKSDFRADAQQNIGAQARPETSTTLNIANLTALAGALQALPPTLTSEMARAALEPLLNSFASTTDPAQLRLLGLAARSLGTKLEQGDAQVLLESVVRSLATATDWRVYRALAQATTALDVKLTDPQAQAVLPKAFEALHSATTTPIQVALISDALAALAPKLPPRQVRAGLDEIMHSLSQTTNMTAVRGMAQAVRALAVGLIAAEADAALDEILKLLARTTSSGAVRSLGQAAQALAARISPIQTQAKVQSILTALASTTDEDQLQALAQTLNALQVPLNATQSQFAVESMLKSFAQPADPDKLLSLVEALRSLNVGLTAEQLQTALQPILVAFSNATDVYDLDMLTDAVKRLGAKLTVQQADAVLSSTLNIIARITPPAALQMMGTVVQTLGIQLTPAQTQDMTGRILTAVKGTTKPTDLRLLTEAFLALGYELDERQVELTLDAFASAFTLIERDSRGVADTPQRGALANAVRALAEKFTAKQAKDMLALARKGLAEARSEVEAEAWAKAAVALSRLPAHEYIATTVELLKYPTAAGIATGVLLNGLRDRIPDAPKDGLVGAVPWFQQRLGVEAVTRPPQRPGAPIRQ